MREINFRGVKLAREAREISGQPVWLAGDGRARWAGARAGATSCCADVAEAAFTEQMAALWEAGADLLILETFSDLPELRASRSAWQRPRPICPSSPR